MTCLFPLALLVRNRGLQHVRTHRGRAGGIVSFAEVQAALGQFRLGDRRQPGLPSEGAGQMVCHEERHGEESKWLYGYRPMRNPASQHGEA